MNRKAAIEVMAQAICCLNGCASDEWADVEVDHPCKARDHRSRAGWVLDALHRWADAQGLALAVPKVATEGMQYAATGRAQLPDIPLYGSIYTAMIAAAPDVLGVGE